MFFALRRGSRALKPCLKGLSPEEKSLAKKEKGASWDRGPAKKRLRGKGKGRSRGSL
jgi:hypothetical protein